MTVEAEVPESIFTPDGVLTAFTLGFEADSADQVVVKVDGAVVTGWTLVGGQAVFAEAPEGDYGEIYRVTETSQESDFANQDGVRPRAAEAAWDKLTRIVQELAAKASRTVRSAIGEAPPAIPRLADRLSGWAAWSNGALIAVTAALAGSAPLSAYMEGLLTTSNREALQAELAVINLTPFCAKYGGVGDGVADDRDAVNDCIDDAHALVTAFPGLNVAVDGGFKPCRVIAGPAIHKGNVRVRRFNWLFSTVAAHTNDYVSVYAAIVGEGTLSADITTLMEPSIPGSQMCVVGASGPAAGDLVLIGSNPPVTTTTGTHSSSDHTLNVVSTAPDGIAFPARGVLLLGTGEKIAFSAVAGATSFTIRTSPEGRGRQGTTAASIPAGTRVTLLNCGQWAMSRTTPVAPAEPNYVQAIRGLSTGKRSLLLRHSMSRIFSPNQGAWVRRVTALQRPELEDCAFIGSTSQGRVGGQEVGFYYRYADGFRSRGLFFRDCSDAHGALDTCFNFDHEAPQVIGKADNSQYDGHYAVSLMNGNAWGSVRAPRARNAYKVATAWASGVSSSGMSATKWFGFPRHISFDGGFLGNGGTPWDNAHEMFEIHCWAEDLAFNNMSGADAAGGVSTEGGKRLKVKGGLVNRWARSAIGTDGAYALLGLDVEGLTIGRRTYLAAGTKVANGFNSSTGTIELSDGDWPTDVLNDGTDVMIKLVTAAGAEEWIKLGTRGGDGVTYTGCTRGMYGTTAVAHLAGERVEAIGNAYATPVDLDLTNCVFYTEDPDMVPAALTADVNTSATTFPVNDTARYQGASTTNPIYTEVENEVAVNGYFQSEWVAVTAASTTSGAGNLTVVRGAKGTTPVAHSTGILLQPGTVAIRDVQLDCGAIDHDIPRAFVSITGLHPSENCSIRRLGLNWRGARRMNTSAVIVEPHSFKVNGGDGQLVNLPYGVRHYGNRGVVKGLDGVLDTPDAAGGELFRLEGSRSRARGNSADGYYLTGRTATAAAECIMKDNEGQRIAAGTNGLDDGSTGATATVDGNVVNA